MPKNGTSAPPADSPAELFIIWWCILALAGAFALFDLSDSWRLALLALACLENLTSYTVHKFV
jgi:hypothetical protein